MHHDNDEKDSDKDDDDDSNSDILFFCESTWPYMEQHLSLQAHSDIAPHAISPKTTEVRKKGWMPESATFISLPPWLPVHGWG